TEHLLKWWGPEGCTISEHNLDWSQPGAWSSVIMNADGKRFKVSGEVLAIDPPSAVEFTWGWHDEHDERGYDSHVRLELRPDGAGGTHFTVLHTGLADEESAANHNIGWTATLAKLERLVN
ncbi:MAG: SRPBCC family protein, partial [Aestuariivirgaceae bacterium]